MKRLIVFVIAIMFCSPVIASARRDVGPPEWTFDNVADLSDWRDAHDIEPISVITKIKDANGDERSVLRIIPTGDDPYVYPGGSVANWEPFSGYEHSIIYIGVRLEKSDVWQVDYINSPNTEYDARRSKKFNISSNKDFVDLKLDMQWEGLIKGLRIHLGTSKNKTIEIDYLSLQGPVRVSQQSRKLATTWGKVKDLF
jgi:hypothetical protein